jgi:hypothetical protein
MPASMSATVVIRPHTIHNTELFSTECASKSITDLVSGKHLNAILVLDADVAGRLDPCFTIHLHWHSLVSQDGDLDTATLHIHCTYVTYIVRMLHTDMLPHIPCQNDSFPLRTDHALPVCNQLRVVRAYLSNAMTLQLDDT